MPAGLAASELERGEIEVSEFEIGVLGPVRLLARGREVPLPRRQVRGLLAALATVGGRDPTLDLLIDALWEGSPPKRPAHALHVYVNRLRTAHPGLAAVVQTTPSGYRLDYSKVEVDADRFETLVDTARPLVDADPLAALGCLDAALDLWRGPALGDFRYADFAADCVVRLAERRLAAMEDRFELLLLFGRAQEVIADLRQWACRHPFRERLTALLIDALQQEGRTVESLEVYREHAALIQREFGAAPSPGVRSLVSRVS